MNDYIYYNGKYSPYQNAAIPLTDRSIYFGDGCYEVMLMGRGVPYQFDKHFERLNINCKRLMIPFSLTKRELLSVIYRLSDLSCVQTAVIYIQVSRNGDRRNHEISERHTGCNLLVTLNDYTIPKQRELKAITVSDKRHTLCDIKSLNLLYSVISLNEAMRRGCDCAIFIKNGIVTEESRSNLFIYKDNRLVTHPLDECILPGITRSNIIHLSDKLGIKVSERNFGEQEMLCADEIFISSTTKFVFRICEINGISCGMKNDEIFHDIYNNLTRDFLHNSIN